MQISRKLILWSYELWFADFRLIKKRPPHGQPFFLATNFDQQSTKTNYLATGNNPIKWSKLTIIPILIAPRGPTAMGGMGFLEF